MTKDKYSKLPIFHFSDELKKRHVKKNLRAVIFGNFGAMNLGDEAILAGEIQELRKIPNIQITVVSRFPEEVKKLHKVNTLQLYKMNKVRREIKKSDIIIVGGGGLINKVERSAIGFAFQLYMLTTFFFLPQMYKKKLYIMGIGVYENANPLIVKLALPFFRYASFLTVRDFHSHEFLKKKNVVNSLYKDNSFLMDLLPQSELTQLPFFTKHYRKNRKNIAISLVKPENNKDEKRLIKELLAFIDKHKDTSDFWYYATDYNPAYANDTVIGETLAEAVKMKFGSGVTLHMVPTKLTPQEAFSSFKLMEFIVAMRFHAAVFAYRNKVNFAGISYDKKCASFIESVGKKPLYLKSLTSQQIEENIL